ncbi:Serine carboxypeptidase-like 48 [Camellia lanceoleosa]|uniref:Serine carboxypeptidase-like 48 n=1 Tax=Camellia lanceoleosa TaxID=1840588 RepID=A0ACC0GR79_9ERIC|nr:Serine carboxypeptidase-like 48 [Camellia lanceoleosa]
MLQMEGYVASKSLLGGVQGTRGFGVCIKLNLIFVDQLIGTGFSYRSSANSTCHNEESISNDLFDFLQPISTIKREPRQVCSAAFESAVRYALMLCGVAIAFGSNSVWKKLVASFGGL